MMVKKKTKAKKGSGSSKLRSKDVWFKTKDESKESWGITPVNWKGYFALILLVGLNVFAVCYFDLNIFDLNNYLKMGVVFLLSVFIFIEFSKRKTVGGKK